MPRGQWVQVRRSSRDPHFLRDKSRIEAACRAHIEKVLKPRFVVRPSKEFNYAIDLRGGWYSTSFRFVQRYRSGTDQPEEFEFDAPLARIEYAGPNRFNVWWFRHTNQWWRLHSGVSLEKALELMESEGILQPL